MFNYIVVSRYATICNIAFTLPPLSIHVSLSLSLSLSLLQRNVFSRLKKHIVIENWPEERIVTEFFPPFPFSSSLSLSPYFFVFLPLVARAVGAVRDDATRSDRTALSQKRRNTKNFRCESGRDRERPERTTPGGV